jgi:hypothetical protein
MLELETRSSSNTLEETEFDWMDTMDMCQYTEVIVINPPPPTKKGLCGNMSTQAPPFLI